MFFTIRIKPQPTLPPVPKLKFSPLTPFLNGNAIKAINVNTVNLTDITKLRFYFRINFTNNLRIMMIQVTALIISTTKTRKIMPLMKLNHHSIKLNKD